MSLSRIRKSIRNGYGSIRRALRPFISAILAPFQPWAGSIRSGVTKPQTLAYRVVGRKTARFLPLFKDLDVNLRKSGINVSFKAYVSVVILATVFVSICVLVLIPLLLVLVLRLALFISFLFGVGASLLAGALTVVVCYIYPIYRADSLRRELEDGLSFTAGYMSILAGAGVTPECIFRSLAQAKPSVAVSKESRIIMRDVGLFGSDILSALDSASIRSPSERFKQLLQGFIATVHSGGSLEKYLADRSRQYMRLKRIGLSKFSDALAVLAEFYVSLLVAGPLILVVMLSVMAMLGGGGSGLFDPRLLLQLLTYLGIPIGSIAFLVILDVLSPRW